MTIVQLLVQPEQPLHPPNELKCNELAQVASAVILESHGGGYDRASPRPST
jgi:hypothetical protein